MFYLCDNVFNLLMIAAVKYGNSANIEDKTINKHIKLFKYK